MPEPAHRLPLTTCLFGLKILVAVQHIVASGLQELFCHVAEQSQKGDHGLFNPSASYDFGQFLDRFYLSRVGMRVLVGQHIMLHHPQEGFIGIIQSECQPAVVCKHAVDDATSICMHSYGMAPEVKLLGATGMKLPYIPEHLHYIFFELLKNSMRAVVERHGESGVLPPIEVVFAEGKEDIAIKISDKGGGIPRSGMSRLWSYSVIFATPSHDPSSKIPRHRDCRHLIVHHLLKNFMQCLPLHHHVLPRRALSPSLAVFAHPKQPTLSSPSISLHSPRNTSTFSKQGHTRRRRSPLQRLHIKPAGP